MDKKVTFAVAGSGKTASIVDSLDLDRRALLLTYTINTQDDLRRRLIAKFGHLPSNVALGTYFSFLNGFCYRPYLLETMRSKGITFSAPSQYSARQPLKSDARYMDAGRRLYHNRIAKLLDVKGCLPDLRRRVERYYDAVFVDEVQDFGGHDFDFLMEICGAQVETMLVGDFHQHTYSTSHDGSVNKSLHDDYQRYQNRFADAGFRVDTNSLVNSHRCSDTVCSFIREHICIEIHSSSDRASTVTVVEKPDEADRLHADGSVVKLFLQEHWRYSCYSQTWGSSKGLDHYQDVCVVMNDKTWRDFVNGELRSASPVTRNKLYVACSRARRHLYLAPERLFKKFKKI